MIRTVIRRRVGCSTPSACSHVPTAHVVDEAFGPEPTKIICWKVTHGKASVHADISLSNQSRMPFDSVSPCIGVYVKPGDQNRRIV